MSAEAANYFSIVNMAESITLSVIYLLCEYTLKYTDTEN